MQNSKWVFARASVIGNSHISENIPCQDANDVFQDPKFKICVVSDGAGSCSNSNIGSTFAVTSSIFHFKNLIQKKKWFIKNNAPSKDKWHKEAKRTLKLVKEDLFNFSINEGHEFKSLSCTLIVLIILEDNILITHIGDGRAGYCNFDNEWFALIVPFKGELANQTVFLTSDIWNSDVIDTYIESSCICEPVKAICLLTDGCEKAAFECYLYDKETGKYYDPNRPFPSFFNKNIDLLPKLIQTGRKEDINPLWEKFLSDGNDTLRIEPDDKTLILGVKYEALRDSN